MSNTKLADFLNTTLSISGTDVETETNKSTTDGSIDRGKHSKLAKFAELHLDLDSIDLLNLDSRGWIKVLC